MSMYETRQGIHDYKDSDGKAEFFIFVLKKKRNNNRNMGISYTTSSILVLTEMTT